MIIKHGWTHCYLPHKDTLISSQSTGQSMTPDHNKIHMAAVRFTHTHTHAPVLFRVIEILYIHHTCIYIHTHIQTNHKLIFLQSVHFQYNDFIVYTK